MEGNSEKHKLVTADIVVLVVYFVLVLGFGLVSSLRNRGSVGGYFLAGRSMHWIPVGASLFASNIGSGHFIGLAGSGAAAGIGIAVFELNAMFVLLILGWVFVPVYIASGVFTMPEYIKKRFGGQRIRIYLSVLALLLYVFTKVAPDLYAGATFIEQALGWNLYVAIIVLLAIAALFTILGGLTAVIWTDFIQTVIMLIGAFALMIISFMEFKQSFHGQSGFIGVANEFFQASTKSTQFHIKATKECPADTEYANQKNTSFDKQCLYPPNNSLHLFRSYDDNNLPWPGVLFGLTISSVWYWCSDQVIVQRALAARDLTHAKAGTILAGYLKILPMWLLVLPGMIARILYTDTVGCVDPDICECVCGIRSGCTNIAYPTLVIELMPDGLRGLMLAVMIAALMSSLTSIFNSSSTIFTMDIWRRIRKNASDMELMVVGRIFVLVMVIIGIVWIPIVKSFSELFHYIQMVTSCLASPICALYVIAVFWKRANEIGAFSGLMVGLVVGLIRIIWECSYTVPPCVEMAKDNRPAIIKDVHYLHFGIILFCITAFVIVIVSLFTKAVDERHLLRLTFWSRHSKEDRLDLSEAERVVGLDNPALDASGGTISKGSSSVYIEPEPESEALPWYKTVGMWVCGIEKQKDQPQLSPEEMLAIEKKQTSLYENPLWKRVINVNAVIVMTVAVFIWGFFY